jgi:malonyl-CoA O-methyltransferase
MPAADPNPPTIDPVAAQRWARLPLAAAPWLHEHVGAQMEQRLQWIRRAPRSWIDWDPLRGGAQAHAAVARRYPEAVCFGAPDPSADARTSATASEPAPLSWWDRLRARTGAAPRPPAQGVDLVWANMLLHHSASPQALIGRWFAAVAVDGFLMFSCLGPDSLRELRTLYARRGWPVPAHELTDMHDWGDMLVQAGFAEPVMDMARVTLAYRDPARLLSELRELGRNLHPARFGALRGRGWLSGLASALEQELPREPGTDRLLLGFEVIFGHAFKPPERARVAPRTELSLDGMRAALKRGRGDAAAA